MLTQHDVQDRCHAEDVLSLCSANLCRLHLRVSWAGPRVEAWRSLQSAAKYYVQSWVRKQLSGGLASPKEVIVAASKEAVLMVQLLMLALRRLFLSSVNVDSTCRAVTCVVSISRAFRCGA